MADSQITGTVPGSEAACERLQHAAERLSLLVETGKLLASEVNLDRLLAMVMQETTRVLRAERSSLFLLDRERGELWSKIAQGIVATEIRFPVDRGVAGYVTRSGQTVNIQEASSDERFNPDIDRSTGFQTRSMLAVPLKNRQGEILGVIQALNKTGAPCFHEEDVELLQALASQAAISIENAFLYERIERLFEAFVDTIVAAIDARDPTTAGHSHRVAAYSLNLARALHHSDDPEVAELRFTPESLQALRYAAILHDVGKIGVREQVLCKRYLLLAPELALVEERVRRARAEALLEAVRRGAGPPEPFFDELLALVTRRRCPGPLDPAQTRALDRAFRDGLLTERQHRCLTLTEGNLTEAEWLDMRSHAVKSYELLAQIPWPEHLARVPDIAGSHHEKLDGSGYPRGLGAAEYPFESRIVCVADIYDALTASDRPYKRAYAAAEARDILEQEAEAGKVDSRLVRVFFARHCEELPAEVPRPSREPPQDPPL